MCGSSKTRLICVLTLLFIQQSLPGVSAQSVVPDGTTATTVSTDAGGTVTVDIAPADANAVSLNRYSDFSVGLPGVNLDNVGVAAETIVNEVTSGNSSLIEGPVTVLGPVADVIIANPNGITVNGGSFHNTNNLALATGSTGLDASGRVTSQIRGGTISVGAGGLSGTMKELDLIAKTIQLSGAVTHNIIDADAKTNLVAGDSDVVFDPDRPFPNILPWASATSAGGVAPGAVSVDITRPSSLNSGSIRVTVTDAGAGVNMAGTAFASVGEFRLSADGKLDTEGAEITAAQAVDITAGEVSLGSDTRQTKLLSQQSGVIIETTSGDIDLGDSSIEGQIIASSNLASAGGITLISNGAIRHRLGADGYTPALTTSEDGIALFAQGDVELEGVTVSSGDNVVITTTEGIFLDQTVIDAEGDISFLANLDAKVLSSQIYATNDVSVTAARIELNRNDAATENTRPEIIAESGGVTIETTSGDFYNSGGLVEGQSLAVGDPRSMGAVTILSAADIINESVDVDHFGVLFADQGTLYLESIGSIFNDNGRLFSNSDIRISSAHDFTNQTGFTGTVDELEVIKRSGDRSIETLWLKESLKIDVLGDFGDPRIDNELALVLAIGDVEIAAENISNIAGDISGSNVTLDAVDTFTNEARLAGSVEFKQRCFFFCTTSGHSDVVSTGGSINAAQDLLVTAGVQIHNQAGSLIGSQNATFIAPSITSEPLQIPLFIQRPSGLTGFFMGRRGWLGSTFDTGLFGAFGGDLTFDGDVSFSGVDLFAVGEEVFTGTTDIEDFPEAAAIIGREDLGLWWGLFQ